jgi:1-acyl-sn-glycerol-3-phosphate acyltransferase
VLRPIHGLLMWFYFRVEVANRERMPIDGPAILAVTHRSRWDSVVIYCATRRVLRFMASHDEFIGLQGWVMRRLGTYPVNTRRPTPGAMRHTCDLIAAGEAVVIFPEGTIFYYTAGHVHPIKPGTAWLALKCQDGSMTTPVPIIPIRIVYGDRYPRFRTRVRIEVREPIHLGAYLELRRKEAIARLTSDLQRALGDVVDESLAEMLPPRLAPATAQTPRLVQGDGRWNA